MPRETAWRILRSGSETPLREVDPASRAAGLDARDTGLVRQLVGTAIRRKATLQAVVQRYARGKPNPGIVTHLHLGILQLLLLDRIPPHAALSETCDAVARTLGRSKVGYVNGVLRSVQRARREGLSGDPRRDLVGRDLHLADTIFRDPVEHSLLWAEDAYSIPAQLFRRWSGRYGDERARALAVAFLTEPPLSVRIVRGETEELAAELGDANPRPSDHPRILLCDAGAAVLGSAAFAEGRITVQGGTALAAAELVEAREGERVLDLCAAPGGKTAVLAATGARVVACDQDDGRLERARETLERLGLVAAVELRAGDGTAALGDEPQPFDAVLVDAPCSNTGVLGARPMARWRWGPKNLASLTALQDRLLREAAAVTRPGGRLVWSTCSLEAEENGRLVHAFLDEHPDWALERDHVLLPDPERGPVDGGAAFRLRRAGG